MSIHDVRLAITAYSYCTGDRCGAGPPRGPMSVPTPASSFSGSVLVTGGAGFVGARVVRGLLAAGSRVVVADDLSCGDASRLPLGHSRLTLHPLDVTAPRGLTALLGEEGPFDALLHLAARVGVRRVLADPEGCRTEHRAAAGEIVAALRALPGSRRPRLVAASTSEVYQDCVEPLTEGHPLRCQDGEGRWAYAASKLEVERTLDAAPVDSAGSHPSATSTETGWAIWDSCSLAI